MKKPAPLAARDQAAPEPPFSYPCTGQIYITRAADLQRCHCCPTYKRDCEKSGAS